MITPARRLKLEEARLEATNPGDEPRDPSASADDAPAEFILVPVADIELITVPRTSATEDPQA